MHFALQLLADAAANGNQNQPSGSGGLLSLLPLVVIFILFYFFMIRAPMKRVAIATGIMKKKAKST